MNLIQDKQKLLQEIHKVFFEDLTELIEGEREQYIADFLDVTDDVDLYDIFEDSIDNIAGEDDDLINTVKEFILYEYKALAIEFKKHINQFIDTFKS